MAKRGRHPSRRRSQPSRLIVIGASMGGVEALRELFAKLPPALDAAIVVVLHRSTGVNVLPAILAYQSGRPVEEAQDGQPIEAGHVYVAPPGVHTTVDGGKLHVKIGPRENGNRPSIDILFRSAAQEYCERTVAVVLSGALDCGASGVVDVRQRGGVVVVQDPKTALNPQMPISAIDAVGEPDHLVSPQQMGPLLARLSMERRHGRVAKMRPPRERLTGFVCPECNGPIWETNGSMFRCRVGHRFSAEAFYQKKETRLENALWEALNVMQERIDISHRMAERARENGHELVAERFDARARDTEENAAILRDLVYRSDATVPLEEVPPQLLVGKKRNGRKKRRA